jgi:Flp pilus assembly secretin CpaC
LEDDQVATKTRVPFVGDIPIIGTMFGKTTMNRQETELIVLVSPELVHPLDAQELPMMLPGMEIAEPGDVAFYLGGAYVAKYEGPKRGARCAADACPVEPNPEAAREITTRPDYQRSEKYYLYGTHGSSQ